MEQKVKEVLVFGELGDGAMKSDDQYVIVVDGENKLAPQKSFAIKIKVLENEPSHLILKRAFNAFGSTAGLIGVGVVENPATEETKTDKDGEE